MYLCIYMHIYMQRDAIDRIPQKNHMLIHHKYAVLYISNAPDSLQQLQQLQHILHHTAIQHNRSAMHHLKMRSVFKTTNNV